MTPREAKTEDDILQIKHPDIDLNSETTRAYISSEGEIIIGNMDSWVVWLSKSDMEKLIDWYNTGEI